MRTLSQITEQRYTALLEQTGAFFAFSQQQFAEQRIAGIDYVALDSGLLCPKNNVSELVDGFKHISAEGIAQDLAENGRAGVIRRELFNYECFYTCDISDCVDALEPYGISENEIREAYKAIAPTVDY